VPDQVSTRLEDACEFSDYASIIRRVCEESEGGEKIEHRVEPLCPPGRQLAHITPRVTKIPARTTPARDVEQVFRVVETVHLVSEFSEQMRMATLPTRYIEHPRANREGKELDEPR
jgi:hypothetical protein